MPAPGDAKAESEEKRGLLLSGAKGQQLVAVVVPEQDRIGLEHF